MDTKNVLTAVLLSVLISTTLTSAIIFSIQKPTVPLAGEYSPLWSGDKMTSTTSTERFYYGYRIKMINATTTLVQYTANTTAKSTTMTSYTNSRTVALILRVWLRPNASADSVAVYATGYSSSAQTFYAFTAGSNITYTTIIPTGGTAALVTDMSSANLNHKTRVDLLGTIETASGYNEQ